MFRALLRRFPLAASLVMLVSVSLFSGVPATHAASQISPVCKTGLGDTLQHCYVDIKVNAPALDASSGIDNSGVASTIQLFNPFVGKNDGESVAQETAYLCWPSCESSGLSNKAELEFGWAVGRYQTWIYPNSPDTKTHLFVAVRSDATGINCLVTWANGGWGCNGQSSPASVWNGNPPNDTSDYPGKVLTGTSGNFFIAFCGGCGNSWWFNYNGNWIGNVSASTLGTILGTPLFTSVGQAGWQGEVALSTSVNSPTTWMGNGTCGTNASKSAHISNMQISENGHPWVNAAALSPLFEHTYSKWYDGIPPTSTNNALSYGGPMGCH